uniref:Uncharacterized protein n=1 Tax=Arundo donax TaxID=35708 RepID=A0A0A9FZZ3_ARUDO
MLSAWATRRRKRRTWGRPPLLGFRCGTRRTVWSSPLASSTRVRPAGGAREAEHLRGKWSNTLTTTARRSVSSAAWKCWR